MVKKSAIDVIQTLAELQRIPNLQARLEDMVWVQYRIVTRYNDVIDYGNELLAHIDTMIEQPLSGEADH